MTVRQLRLEIGTDENGRYESEETLRCWIKSETCPFAYSVKRGERTIFLIFRPRFEAWQKGNDFEKVMKSCS